MKQIKRNSELNNKYKCKEQSTKGCVLYTVRNDLNQ